MTEDEITEIARRLGRVYKRRKLVIATAESCTAGGVAAAITRISGSAKWFDRGFVTYTNQAKKDMLGVRQRTLRMRGAVSEQVAHEMVVDHTAIPHKNGPPPNSGLLKASLF